MHVLLYGSYTRKPYRPATSGEIERMLSAARLDHLACPAGRGGDVFIAPAADDEEFWAAWHARHPQPETSAAGVAAEAASLGRDAGRAAASWVFDANTSEATCRAVLRGIDDGDPAILDAYPAPGLSASGGYTEASLARDLGLDDDQLPPAAATAYLDAAAETFWHQTERIAREHLSGTAAGAGLADTGAQPGR